MSLTSAQYQALKTAILADPVLAAKPLTAGAAFEIAIAFNLDAAPAFWVWRTNVSRAEIYGNVSADATVWNWTTYKAQAATEQNAWTQMFMGDQADFSKANLRAGVSAIFGAANAQTAHVLAIGRRLASRAEKLFATGTGSSASPATMAFEGAMTSEDVQIARELP